MKEDSKLRRLLFLFGYFARIGSFTFGGGWSIISQMQRDFVDKRHWMTEEDLVDMTSVGRSIPGVMIGNVSYMFGFRIAGVPGGIVSVLGLNAAPFVVLMILTNIYEQFCSNVYVVKALSGVRAAVLPIIGSAALRLRKSSLRDAGCWVIMLCAFALGAFTSFSNVLTVLCGAAAGLVIMGVRRHGIR